MFRSRKQLSAISYLLSAILFMCILTQSGHASVRSQVNAGNKLYQQKKYNEAIQKYTSAQADAPSRPQIDNNLGLTYYQQGDYETAQKDFLRASEKKGLDNKQRSSIKYNLGNAFYKAGNTEEAVKAYKEAIDLNPHDKDARYNLSFLKQQKKQQKQDQKKEDKKDQQKQKDKDKDKQKKEQQNKDKKEDKQDKPKQGQEQKQDISKEDAKRILDALQKQEENNPVTLNKRTKGESNVEKDW